MRFNTIQILRFLAAASVVLYHGHYYVGEWLWKTPLTRAFDYRFSWGVALRLLRIYPAFWLAAALVSAARIATGRPWAFDRLPQALTLLPLGGGDSPIGGVEWSLVYEVFFYTLLAVIAKIPLRNAREWAMLAWLVAIAALTRNGPVHATSFGPTFATIAFSAFNLPFIAGVLAYSWFGRTERLPVAALVIAVPLALVAAERAGSTELQLAFQAAGFAAAVLIAAELSRRRDVASSNPLVRLGDWSYGLYLVHVPVIQAVLVAGEFTPDAANVAFVTAVGAALVVGSGYGAVEIALYHRNKGWLRRRWPGSRAGAAAAG
jgi:peptidoglycan/LPS O-acetylase OafA/YrhL